MMFLVLPEVLCHTVYLDLKQIKEVSSLKVIMSASKNQSVFE